MTARGVLNGSKNLVGLYETQYWSFERVEEKWKIHVLQGSVVENANHSVYQETESQNEFKVKLGTNWDQVKCTYNV